MRKIIFFELNEVPYRVIDYFTSFHPDSVLAQTLPKCHQLETVTEDEGELSPWITWPTLHRGVSNQYHQIKDFGESLDKVDAQYPPIWKILAEAGHNPAVFASMHTYPLPKDHGRYAFYVPDPFAGEAVSHPRYIEPFQAFNLAMSRRSGRNVDTGIDKKSALALLLSLHKIGVTPHTLLSIAKQLLDERLVDWKKNRRRVFQSVMAFDVYHKLLKQHQPAFSTFFSNHAASTMHRYWAATFPEDYQTYNLSQEWQQKFKGEIGYAMQWFNHFFGKLKAFADRHPEYLLVVASSMGQEATKAEELKTELYAHGFEKFIAYLGLTDEDWERRPAMHPQYNLKVVAEREAFFLEQLQKVRVKGDPLVFRHKEEGFFSINLGHRNLEDEQIVFDGFPVDFKLIGFQNEGIDDESDGTAYHIPEGCFFVYDPKDTTLKPNIRQKVSSSAVAPSILDNFGLKVPSYMTEERIQAISQKQPVKV